MVSYVSENFEVAKGVAQPTKADEDLALATLFVWRTGVGRDVSAMLSTGLSICGHRKDFETRSPPSSLIWHTVRGYPVLLLAV